MLRELGIDDSLRLLSTFSCPRNFDVENFLVNPAKAIRFEDTGNARTYLILDEATSDLLAYFSVSFKELILEGTGLSKTKVRSLDGISKNAERIRSFLIGQLGKNTSISDNPIGLTEILNEAYAVFSAAKQLIGGRVIILECENIPELIAYYEQHGFSLIEIATGDSSLRTLYIHITE